MRSRRAPISMAAVLLPVVIQSALAGTITDGDASLSFAGIPTFSLPQGDATILTDTTSVDELYKYGWYYRTPSSTQTSLMSKLDTPTEEYLGNTAIFTWTDAGPALDRFSAQLIVRITDDPGPGRTTVSHTMRFTNTSTGVRTYQLFNLIDIDLSATPLNDSIAGTELTGPFGIRALMTEAAGGSAELFGLNATHWQFGSGSVIRAALTGGNANLDDAAQPFTGDCAGGFQWTITLAPGETTVLYGGFAIDRPMPCPADVDLNSFVNGDDADSFALLFYFGDPMADFDHNGFVNGDDMDFFAARFYEGC